MSTNPNPGFELESWCLYTVGAICVILRLVSRTKRQGIGGLQVDDYLVVFGLLSFTLLCVSFNQMLRGAGSNLMTPEDIAALTPAISAQRVEGSKWVFVSEHAMLMTIWSMKGAMLVLYARITEGLMQRKILNGVIVWVAISFVGDELALFTICRPTRQYWAVPPEDAQCATYQYYQVVNAVFNISTDVMLLAVGLPPILRARLSIQQKAILGVVLGMGSFVIVAAILRAIYCLVPSLISYVYMNWYFREASVAIYVTNAPAIWILMRDMFPGLQRLGRSSRQTASNKYSYQPKSASHGQVYTTSQGSGAPAGSKASWVKMGGYHFDDREGVDLEELPINKHPSMTTTRVTPVLGKGIGDELQRDNSQDTAELNYQDRNSHMSPLGSNQIRQDVTFSVEHVMAKSKV